MYVCGCFLARVGRAPFRAARDTLFFCVLCASPDCSADVLSLRIRHRLTWRSHHHMIINMTVHMHQLTISSTHHQCGHPNNLRRRSHHHHPQTPQPHHSQHPEQTKNNKSKMHQLNMVTHCVVYYYHNSMYVQIYGWVARI